MVAMQSIQPKQDRVDVHPLDDTTTPVLVCGVLAGHHFLQLRAQSAQAMAAMPAAVNAVFDQEGFNVEVQCVGDTMGAVSGIDASGARIP